MSTHPLDTRERDMAEVVIGPKTSGEFALKVRVGYDGNGIDPDYTTAPVVDLEIDIETNPMGIPRSVNNFRAMHLEDDEMTALITTLTEQQAKARKTAEAAGYYKWLADGKPDDITYEAA